MMVRIRATLSTIIFLLVPRRQGRILPSRSLSVLLDSDSWNLLYGWEPFLDTLLEDENDKSLEISVAPASLSVIEVNDVSSLQVQCNRYGKVSSLMSVFQYAKRYSSCLDVHHFVLGMRIHGVFFMTRDDGTQRLTAAGGWARHWLHWSRKDTAWCRAHIHKTDSFLFKRRKRQAANTDSATRPAKFFVFFVLGISARIFLVPQPIFAALNFFFHRFGSLIGAPSGKTILTLSVARVSKLLPLDPLQVGTGLIYLPSVLPIGAGSLSLPGTLAWSA